MKKKFILLIIFTNLLISVFAQSALIKSADHEFNKKNYTKAILLYQKAIKNDVEDPSNLPVLKKIGDCFNAVNQYKPAISYYAKYVEKEKQPGFEFLLTYYELLLKTNEQQKALEGFKNLEKTHPQNTEVTRMINCCEFAIREYSKLNLPNIYEQTQLNSSESEFGLAFFNSQLIFASQRFNDNYSAIHGRTNQGFSDLFIAGFDSAINQYTNPKLLSGKINSASNEGSFTFHTATQTAYFTQCETTPDNCRILTSKLHNDKWQATENVLLGAPNFNYAHPCFSGNGKILYFSSDLPGGFGGKDLWKVSVSADGKIGTPENLGPNINTGFDEMFPAVAGDSILLFSTKGHVGMGGLDIFYSKITENVFEPARNLGTPINSTADDFSILLNGNSPGGYFCSNRNNTEKSDDIYAFYHHIFLNDISGIVVDSILATPLSEVKIVYQTNQKTEKIVTSSTNGRFIIPNSAHSNCTQKHTLTLSKENYVTKTIEVPCHAEKECLITMLKNTGIHTISGTVTDILSGKPIEKATITLNTTKQKTDTVFTNKNGEYLLDNIPSNDYVYLRAHKTGYLKDLKNFSTPDITETIEMNLGTGYPTHFQLYPIKKEIEFTIENIYYEFDKANLLPESKVSLNKLAALLNENQQVKIKINSHTDSRGSDSYNEDLSQRRGESVVKYLLEQGIHSIRLKSEGFGERKLAILNARTEAEHQQNRRTTFEIIGEIQEIPEFTKQKTDSPTSETSGLLKKTEDVNQQNSPGFYRIQLVATSNAINKEEVFKPIKNLLQTYTLFDEKSGQLIKYQLGNFNTYSEAEMYKNQCKQSGFPDCFIVPVNN